MKRILACLSAALIAFGVNAATLNPIQLLNPAGSTAGQAIVSTGPSTAPAWSSAFAASTLSGPLTINNPSTSSTSLVINATSDTAAGAAIFLGGPGATTPNKVITAVNGNLSVANSAQSAYIATLTDAGNLSVTGSFAPATGIVGVTNGSNAAAGIVGEYVTGTASAIPLTTGTAANITSISLTAGDWDISGGVTFINAATTVAQGITASVNTTSATVDFTTGAYFQLNTTFPAAAVNSAPAPVVRKSFTTTTTVFLVGAANFTTSTLTANGFIRARRVR